MGGGLEPAADETAARREHLARYGGESAAHPGSACRLLLARENCLKDVSPRGSPTDSHGSSHGTERRGERERSGADWRRGDFPKTEIKRRDEREVRVRFSQSASKRTEGCQKGKEERGGEGS